MDGNNDCSALLIDGKDAAANGYPDVKIKYTFKICNFNDSNSIKTIDSQSKSSKIQMFYRDSKTNTKEFLVDKTFKGDLLEAGKCREEIAITVVSTNRAKYYMKAVLQGVQQSSNGGSVTRDGFCYAYSFHKVDFKYNYGLGECKVSVSENLYFVSRIIF